MDPRTNSSGSRGKGQETREVAKLLDRRTSSLVAAGAAMAANSTACLRRVVGDLGAAGVPVEQIQAAVQIGQMAKDKPALLLKREADALTGTHLAAPAALGTCPIETMASRGLDLRVPLLVAASSALAAGCEPCLNSIVPRLIESGVADADIRKALEIGQGIKDRAAANMREVADVLARTNLLGDGVVEDCDRRPTGEAAACCT